MYEAPVFDQDPEQPARIDYAALERIAAGDSDGDRSVG
jgi:hypothetical protein